MFGRIVSWLAKRGLIDATPSRPDPAARAALRAQPFPDAWRAYVDEVPHARHVTATQRAKLQGDIQVFVGEKQFVGEDGFVIDDRVKVIVATCAAVLVLARDIAMFDHVLKIIIRDDELAPRVAGHYIKMQSQLGDTVMDTWSHVELSWREVTSGFSRPADGQNTAFHELAHAFDDADGKLDALLHHEHYNRWSTLLHKLPLHHRIDGHHLYTEVIGDATGPELFASASELFFECPNKLRDLDAALFTTLVEIYGFDPRALVDR